MKLFFCITIGKFLALPNCSREWFIGMVRPVCQCLRSEKGVSIYASGLKQGIGFGIHTPAKKLGEYKPRESLKAPITFVFMLFPQKTTVLL